MTRAPVVALVALGLSWTVVTASAVAADPATPTAAPGASSQTTASAAPPAAGAVDAHR